MAKISEHNCWNHRAISRLMAQWFQQAASSLNLHRGASCHQKRIGNHVILRVLHRPYKISSSDSAYARAHHGFQNADDTLSGNADSDQLLLPRISLQAVTCPPPSGHGNLIDQGKFKGGLEFEFAINCFCLIAKIIPVFNQWIRHAYPDITPSL